MVTAKKGETMMRKATKRRMRGNALAIAVAIGGALLPGAAGAQFTGAFSFGGDWNQDFLRSPTRPSEMSVT